MKARYLRLTVLEIPYRQKACISGLRVFGKGNATLPEKPVFAAEKSSEFDMEIRISDDNAIGHNILWGYHEDKLYHSYLTYENSQKIGALMKGRPVYVRVDSFNENGITRGDVRKID